MNEPRERFNVVAAMMNLEYKHGTKETQEKMFQRALDLCDPKQVYMQQAIIYEVNGDDKNAEEMFEKVVKKFRKSRKAWERYILFFMKKKDFKKANAILQRSLLSLEKHKRKKMIESVYLY